MRSTNIFWPKKILARKNFGSKKILDKKNVGKIFWIPKKMLSPIKWDPKNLGPISLVKIVSVTAEIFLIWTIVARTNVAWTNITMTVGIFSTCFQEPTFKVWSKSGQ